MRRAVEASPALAAERKRLRGKRKLPPEQQTLPVAVWAVGTVGLLLYLGAASTPRGFEACLALQGALAAAGVWLHARSWLQSVFSGELEVFVTLPAADAFLFDRLRRGTRGDALSWAFAITAAGAAAGYVGYQEGLEPVALFGALGGLSGLLWLGVLGLAPLLAWRAPEWALRAWLATAGLFGMLALGVAASKLRLGGARVTETLAAVGWVCPLSWPGLLCAPWLRGGSWVWSLGLLPALGLIVVWRRVLPAWRSDYTLTPLIDPTAVSPEMVVEGHVDNRMVLESEFNEELVDHPALEPWVRSRVRASVGRAVTLAIEDGAWRAPPPFARGLAALIGRVLDPRQRLVAHMLQRDLGHWGRRLRHALILGGLGGGLTLAAAAPSWIGPVLLILAALSALPVGGGNWTGLEFAATTGGFAPMFAFLPITLPEVVGAVLRVNALRFIVYLPCSLASGAAWTLSGPGWTLGLEVAASAWLFLLAAQPLVLAFRLHERFLAPQLGRLGGLLQLPLAIGVVLGLLAALFGVCALPLPGRLLIVAAVALAGALALATVVRLLGRRDLVRQTISPS